MPIRKKEQIFKKNDYIISPVSPHLLSSQGQMDIRLVVWILNMPTYLAAFQQKTDLLAKEIISMTWFTFKHFFILFAIFYA